MAHPHADLLFSDGPILTVDGARTWASSLAVRDGRVVAIGHDDVKELAGPRTEVVDLRGRLLLPGFQDAHVHAVMGGEEPGQCDLTGTTDPQEYARRIRAYADANPGKEWITGSDWSMESFDGGTPTRDLLDTIVPDRPVYLTNRDHHGAWVGSRALELDGITAATPDPANGHIERRPDGPPAEPSRREPSPWWAPSSPPYHGRPAGRAAARAGPAAKPRYHRLAGRHGGRRRRLPRPLRRPPHRRPATAGSPPPWWARCGGPEVRGRSRSPPCWNSAIASPAADCAATPSRSWWTPPWRPAPRAART
ncbi:amidohydrolase family protein [Nonomuraea polychroma]|uniref:amidohydrolase family protein n=1 Tax=Nonomuraea polychroma TaxID=46176 RepID=UPI0019D42A27|nr:amidohydrolase family protein [Nonomuraea polychroma]